MSIRGAAVTSAGASRGSRIPLTRRGPSVTLPPLTMTAGCGASGHSPRGRRFPRRRSEATLVAMLRLLLRCFLLVVIALLLVEAVVGLVSDTTGGVEKR